MRIKAYLSYSQYNTFLQSPEQYKKIYIDGIKLNNKFLDFGKKEHEELQKNGKNPETKVTCDFYGIPLLGYIDDFDEQERLIIEHKTGKTKWTQSVVDKNEQLTFYAIMASRQFGMKLDSLKLQIDWYPTIEDVDGSIIKTGEKYSFITARTLKDEIKIYPKIKKAWDGIDQLIDSLIK